MFNGIRLSKSCDSMFFSDGALSQAATVCFFPRGTVARCDSMFFFCGKLSHAATACFFLAGSFRTLRHLPASLRQTVAQFRRHKKACISILFRFSDGCKTKVRIKLHSFIRTKQITNSTYMKKQILLKKYRYFISF